MPEFTVRNIAFTVLIMATLATALAAVALLARQDDNSSVRVILPTTAPAEADIPTEVRVYVRGAVANPGVYTLGSESRIADAVDAAGGITEDGLIDGLNLAQLVADEAEYYILRVGESPPVDPIESPPTTGPAVATGWLIDLNLASAETLDTLPGIGPVLAQAIIDYREKVRPFQSIAEVQEVPKIGPRTFADISHLITVSGQR